MIYPPHLDRPPAFATKHGLRRLPPTRYQWLDPREFRNPNGPLPRLRGGRGVRGPGFREGGGGKRRPLRRVTCLLLPPALKDLARIPFPPPRRPLPCWLSGRRSQLLVPRAGQRVARAHASHTCFQSRARRGPKLFSKSFGCVFSAQEVYLVTSLSL